jgi:hypothetical protein
MAPFPGRKFRMQQLVRYCTSGRAIDEPATKAARKAVARVLEHLEQSGSVIVTPAAQRGGFSTYSWKA